MSVVRFRLENGDQVAKQLARLRHGTGLTARAGSVAGAERMRDAVQANIRATFRQRSGQLHDNWRITTGGGRGDRAETTLSTDTLYARIHELGGVITPRRARLLSWVDEGSGERVFAKRVTIPARPYFRPAWDSHANLAAAEREMTVAIQAAVDAAIGGRSIVRRAGHLIREHAPAELGW